VIANDIKSGSGQVKLSSKYRHSIFSLIISVGLGLFISLIFVWIITGLDSGFFLRWAKSFGLAILIAFPTSLIFSPIAQKLVNLIVEAG